MPEQLLTVPALDELTDKLLDYVLEVASGREDLV